MDKDKWWVYECPDVESAGRAIQRLDTWPQDKVVGLGVAVKGWLEQPEQFFVFVNGEGLTSQEVGQIDGIVSEFGEPSPWKTFGDLYASEPTPHLVAGGFSETILATLSAQYPDARF